MRGLGAAIAAVVAAAVGTAGDSVLARLAIHEHFSQVEASSRLQISKNILDTWQCSGKPFFESLRRQSAKCCSRYISSFQLQQKGQKDVVLLYTLFYTSYIILISHE